MRTLYYHQQDTVDPKDFGGDEFMKAQLNVRSSATEQHTLMAEAPTAGNRVSRLSSMA
jgi:hypothetical protein